MKLHPALNRAWIASHIGVSKQFISRIENGHAKMPLDKQIKLNEVLREISKQLTVPIDEEKDS
jgi:DNA-binding XRE family transcriptional regulator